MRPVANLSRFLRQLVVGWLARVSYFVPGAVLPELEPEIAETVRQVRPYTMTTRRRIAALCDSVEYVVRSDVPGAIGECGVWRGGSMMAVALTLLRLGVTDRDLYLFDTFRGMTPPGEADVPSGYDGYSPMRRPPGRQARRRGAARAAGRAVTGADGPPVRVALSPPLP